MIVSIIYAISVLNGLSCNKGQGNFKLRAYFRLDTLPAKMEKTIAPCNICFKKNIHAVIQSVRENCWFNIHYGFMNATLHMTPVRLKDIFELQSRIRETRELAYKNTLKASSIKEIEIGDSRKRYYGIMYEMRGESASPIHFFFTRGALYFNTKSIYDSLAPYIAYIKRDIDTLINTFQWEKESTRAW